MDSWWERAACIGQPDYVFFSPGPKRNDVKAAKALCKICPVITECLDAAMREEEPKRGNGKYRYGVRGGLTGEQRRKLSLSMRL